MTVRPINSRQALEILHIVRPRANNSSLSALVRRGLITPVEVVNRTRFRYDPESVRRAALRLADLDGLALEAVAAKLAEGAR